MFEFCIVLPFNRSWMDRGRLRCLTPPFVTRNGPIGAKVSVDFCAKPLAVVPLQIAGGNVIEDGVSRYVIDRIFDRYVTGAAAHDNGEFGFVVDHLAHLRNDDRIFWTDDGTGVHCEKQRLGWGLRFGFLYMIFIVQTNADDFVRAA